MAQDNGRLDPSGLKALSVGGRLTPGAADAFEQLRTAGSRAGVTVTITSAADAYRLYEIQERIFLDRYQEAYTQYAPGKVDRRMWQGRYWFRRAGTAAAAVPGTSNHGWALAVDIANVGGFNSAYYGWLTDNAPQFGFSNAEGASVGEAWHWVYSPTLHASHGGGSGTPGTTTPPTSEEDDMTPEQDAALKVIFDNQAHINRRLDEIGTEAALGRVATEVVKTNTGPIRRNGAEVSLRQEIADTKTSVQSLNAGMQYYRVSNGAQAGDVYEVGPLTSDKLSAQHFEDIKSTIVPRMQDITQAGMMRLTARKAALRTHIFGPDKGGK